MKSFNMLLICFDWNVIFINSSYFKPLDSISLLRITASHFYLLNSFSGMKDSLYLILSSDDFIRYFYKIFKFHFWLFKISSISPDFTFAIALQKLIPLSPELIINIGTVGLFLVGVVILGKKFAMKTIVSTICYPMLLSLCSFIATKYFPADTFIMDNCI